MQTVIERKLDTCRMNDNRLIKTTVLGMMNATSKRGRPARKWLDDVREWCKQSIHTTQSSGTRSNEIEINCETCMRWSKRKYEIANRVIRSEWKNIVGVLNFAIAGNYRKS